MTSKNLFALLAMMSLVAPAAMATDQQPSGTTKDSCKTIRGEYIHANGWPPYERIVTSDGKMYGLISSFEPDSDLQVPDYPIPDSLQQIWDANEDAAGEFLFCLSPDAEKFKEYMREPMELGWIKSFTPADANNKANFIRKIKIAAIQAVNEKSKIIEFSKIEVSFDYLDGVVSNAKIEQSEDKHADVSVVLAAINKANYPPMPSELKGQKLHIELPIYLGVGD